MQGFDKAASVKQIYIDLHLDPLGDQPLMVSLGYLWDSFADKVPIYPRLQELYTRRAAIDNLAGGVWQSITWTQAGVSESGSDLFKNVQTMRTNIQDEIVRLESFSRANRPAAAAVLTSAPSSAPIACGRRNPNDPALGGDPVRRTGLNWLF